MTRLARLFVAALLPLAGLVFVVGSVGAASVSISPWAYACGSANTGNPATATADCEGSSGGTASASYSGGVLTLSKNGPTTDDLASGATVSGLVHISAISYDISGYCGAGAPRFNITTSDGNVHFFGCSANNTAGHVVLDLSAAGDGNGKGGVQPTDTVTDVEIVQDESTCTPTGDCQDNPAVLSNIVIVGTGPVPSPVPCNSTASATRCPSPPPAPKPPTTGVGLESDNNAAIAIGIFFMVALALIPTGAIAYRRNRRDA